MSIYGTATVVQAGDNSATVFLENEDPWAEVGLETWQQLPAGRLKSFLTRRWDEGTAPATVREFFFEASKLGLRVTIMGNSDKAYIPVAYWTVINPETPVVGGYARLVVQNLYSTGASNFGAVTISLSYSASE